MTISDVARKRAKALWKKAKKVPSGEIEVLWSGGIDSTAALTALLETQPAKTKTRLSIKMAPRAIGEYPLFFEQNIEGKLPVQMVDDFDDICEFVNASRL